MVTDGPDQSAQEDEFAVLCFGDSNTWGSVPGSQERYPYATRWPGVLQRELGPGYRVIEEGLSGRTTVLDDPLVPHRNGRDYLVPCMQSHRPLDIVVIFLGTNDLADRYSLPPMDIARAAASLAVLVRASEAGRSGASPTPLLVCPPRLGDMTSRADTMSGALARAAELPRCFRIAADEVDVSLVDLSATITYSDVDGVHLDADGHREVSGAIAGWIAGLIRDSRPKG